MAIGAMGGLGPVGQLGGGLPGVQGKSPLEQLLASLLQTGGGANGGGACGCGCANGGACGCAAGNCNRAQGILG